MFAIEVVKKIAKKLFFPTVKLQTYKNYQEALKNATKSSYQDQDLVEVVFEKTKLFQQNQLQNGVSAIDFKTANLLLSILSLQKEQINVIDFGGACGSHYFEVRKLLPANISLKWIVVETSAMAAKAQALANHELFFSDNLKEATRQLKEIDLFHTSGTLQCVDDPLLYLEEIIATRAKYLLFNRMGFTLRDEPITLLHESYLSEHGIGKLPVSPVNNKIIEFPYTYLSKKDFDSVINTSDYKVIIEFNDDSGISPIQNEPIIGKGFLFKLVQ